MLSADETGLDQGDPRRQLTLAPAGQNPSGGRAMAGLRRPSRGFAPARVRRPQGGLLLRGVRSEDGRQQSGKAPFDLRAAGRVLHLDAAALAVDQAGLPERVEVLRARLPGPCLLADA